MQHVLTPELATEIEVQALKVRRLAGEGIDLKLDRMRDETAALQVLIAEAARLERLASH